MVELCSITWWEFPDITYKCIEKLSNPNVTVQSEVNLSVEVWVGLLFLFCAGFLMAIIIELLYNKVDWFIDPLYNKVVRRYNFTIERNRLRTMQGHP